MEDYKLIAEYKRRHMNETRETLDLLAALMKGYASKADSTFRQAQKLYDALAKHYVELENI